MKLLQLKFKQVELSRSFEMEMLLVELREKFPLFLFALFSITNHREQQKIESFFREKRLLHGKKNKFSAFP